jgi:hypothetical protein
MSNRHGEQRYYAHAARYEYSVANVRSFAGPHASDSETPSHDPGLRRRWGGPHANGRPPRVTTRAVTVRRQGQIRHSPCGPSP